MRLEIAAELEQQIEECAQMGEPPSFALRRDQADWLVAYLLNPAVTPSDWRTLAKTNGELVTAMESQLATMQTALQRIVDASDQFVKDTGLKHGDLITDAVEAARLVLPPPHIRAGVDFITDTRLGGD